MQYTYFVITPGFDEKSFIEYPDDVQGNYFKFGDTDKDTELGIRSGYTTHNPDIGIAGVLTNGLTEGNLGTKIKKDIIEDGYKTVTSKEWFTVTNAQAWALFGVVQGYDEQTINDANYNTFKIDVLNALNNN